MNPEETNNKLECQLLWLMYSDGNTMCVVFLCIRLPLVDGERGVWERELWNEIINEHNVLLFRLNRSCPGEIL